jgi:diguanylate cyclase (GGDEF)-like protein/PAS domain S-box-containing protein
MTEVDGLAALSLTARTIAIGHFSRRWAGALARTGRVTGTDLEIAGMLRPLTLRLARAVHSGTADPELAVDIGAALLNLGYGTTAVLGPTIVSLLDGFADDFATTPEEWPDAAVVQQRVLLLAAAVAEGFATATRDHAFAGQEELQRAALRAVRAAETGRRASEARFRALFDQAGVGIGLVNMAGEVIDANAAWAEMMGYEVSEMRGLTIAEVVTPGGSDPAMVRFLEVLAGTRNHFRMEIVHDNRNDTRLYLDLAVSKVHSAGAEPDFLVGVAVDVTDRKRLEDRLWHESRHDPLTGLPNRTLFFERLDTLLTEPRAGRPVGVCYIDLDGFKSINDGLGHDVGDRVLVRVARRLSQAIDRPCNLLARLGGDEFGVLITDGDPAEQAPRILAALADPITVDGRELTVSASVGVVDTMAAGMAADGLMRAADITLYLAKARGRGRWERHDPQRNADQVTRHTLGTEMSAALARGEFFLEYQPLVSLQDGTVRRVEALVRWQHPRLGLLYPDQFIQMAEENGHIGALGRWVLSTAGAAAYDWHQRFPAAEVGVNVNVAAGQLYDPDLAEYVRATLTRIGLPAHLLYLELTESAVLGEAPGPVDALAELAAAGIRLVIDDFGTGYSNLIHLSRLPACELKIAGSFLQSSDGDLANDKILPAIISLAHSLGLSVTAEAVETAEQAALLRELKCDTAQGYYFAAPAAAEEITRLIAADTAAQ